MRFCPVCQSENSVLIHHMRFLLPKNYSLPNGYEIVKCEKCGMCYADTIATMQDYEKYYSNCNYYGGVSKKKTWIKKDEIFSNIIARHSDLSSTICDFGFGEGHLLRYLRNKGYEKICGLDPSEESLKILANDEITNYKANIYEKNSTGMLFDVICVMDVFEHLLNPALAVNMLKTYLKDNGVVIISVPNYGYLKSNNLFYTNMFNQEHINYFSPISLDNLFCINGYIRAENTDDYTHEPEIYTAYKIINAKGNDNRVINYDSVTEQSILDYINEKGNSSKVINRLNNIVNNHSRVYLWGGGIFSMWLMANTAVIDHVVAIIDNNKLKWGEYDFSGKYIKIIPLNEIDSDCPIIITAMENPDSIIHQIKECQLSNKVYTVF